MIQLRWECTNVVLQNRFQLSHACKDMIISNFICPAIISPQKFGIVDNDVRIGTIVNHNLVQIAMIIQMISLREFENPPEEYNDFLKQCRVRRSSWLEWSSVFQKTHLISDMMDAILVEDLAPDVAILTEISNTQEKTDMNSKPNFVGSVADLNILVSNQSSHESFCTYNRWIWSQVHHQFAIRTLWES